MESTTISNEYLCAEHNIPGWECQCEVYCEHGISTPYYLLQSLYENQKNKPWFNKRCICSQHDPSDAQYARWRGNITPTVTKTNEDNRSGNWYLVTLTQPDTDKSVLKRLQAAKKVLRSKQVSPEQWCYSIELTAKGTPHIHIALFTYKYPEYRIIKSFNDGHNVDIQREKFNVRNYVVKDETKPTPEMLATWGLEGWFFSSVNYSGPLPDSPKIISSPGV